MIRINLLRNLSADSAGGAAGSLLHTVPADIQRQAALKLLVILIFPLLLFIYQKISISVLEGDEARIHNETNDILNKMKSFGQTSMKVEKYQTEKKRLEKQLELLRALTKNRLREVKTLATLQNLVPDKVWLKGLKVEAGLVSLQGFAESEESFSELVRALDSNVFFNKMTVKSTEQQASSSGTVKKFDIEFRAGKDE